MGLGSGKGGLENAGTAVGNSPTFSGIVTALEFISTQAGGSNGFLLNTSGARLKLSAGGTTDYFTSNGATQITANGAFATVGLLTTSADIRPAAGTDNALDIGTTLLRYRNFYAYNVNMYATFDITNVLAISATAPTIAAGAGAAIVASNGTAAFRIDLGGAAQTGTITLPTATTGWVVSMQNITTPASFIISQTGTTTTTATFTCYSRTTGLAINWNANDNMVCQAMAY